MILRQVRATSPGVCTVVCMRAETQVPTFAEHLLWIDTLVFSNELADLATPETPVDSFDLLTPLQRTCLAAGLYLACFGPSPIPARRRLDTLRTQELDVVSSVSQLRKLLPDGPHARNPAYALAFLNLLATCAKAAVQPEDAVLDPPQTLKPAFREYQAAIIDDRASSSDDREDFRALITLAAVTSTVEYATGTRLRTPLLALTASTLAALARDEEISDPNALGLLVEVLDAKPVDYLPASVMALTPAVGPYVEDLFSLALLSTSIYALQISLSVEGMSEDDLDQAFSDVGASLQRWHDTLYASRRVATNLE